MKTKYILSLATSLQTGGYDKQKSIQIDKAAIALLRLVEQRDELLDFAQYVLSMKTGGLLEGRARAAIADATKD